MPHYAPNSFKMEDNIDLNMDFDRHFRAYVNGKSAVRVLKGGGPMALPAGSVHAWILPELEKMLSISGIPGSQRANYFKVFRRLLSNYEPFYLISYIGETYSK